MFETSGTFPTGLLVMRTIRFASCILYVSPGTVHGTPDVDSGTKTKDNKLKNHLIGLCRSSLLHKLFYSLPRRDQGHPLAS
jgi:hypothetical protein